MADDMPPAVRLSGGELLVASDTVPILRDLLEEAFCHRRDLWTARGEDDRQRIVRLRALVEAAFDGVSASTSDIGSAEGDSGPDLARSDQTRSVQEAADMCELSPRRVRQLLSGGQLSGEQDAPGKPWRVHLDSIRDRQEGHT